MSDQSSHAEYQELLYAYGLDLLTDADRERLELHLAECPECFERAQELDRDAELVSSDPGAVQLIDEITAEAADATVTDDRKQPISRHRIATYVRRFSLAAAIVLVFLILKPWDFQFSPEHDVIASENRLAVLYFDNLTDETDSLNLGQILANLLATDLAEALPIQVVSPHRTAAIYRLLEHKNLVVEGADLIAEVSDRAHARYILSGAVARVDSELVLTAQLTEVPNEQLLMSVSVPGTVVETVFPLVDKLTVHVREAMAIPPPTGEALDLCIADITTSSTKAYTHYVRGLDQAARFYIPEAEREFEKALKYDSTFALAWYELSKIRGGSYIDSAIAYSNNVSRKERRQILIAKTIQEGRYQQAKHELRELLIDYPDEVSAMFTMGYLTYYDRQYDTAISYLSRCIDIDSLYGTAYNSLAYSYDRVGDLERALEMNQMYADLVPDEPNPLDSRGDILARNGKLKEALDAYKGALAVNSMFFGSLLKAGHMLLFMDLPDSALVIYRLAANHQLPGARAYGRLQRAYPLVMQGKLDEALRVLDDGIGADRLEDRKMERAYKHMLKASIYELMGRIPAALTEARLAVDVRRELDSSYLSSADLYAGLLLIQLDSIDQAERLAEEFKAQRHLGRNRNINYLILRGELQRNRGELLAAVSSLEESANSTDQFHAHYRLGLAYLEAGESQQAAAVFENQLRNYTWWRLQWSAWNLQMYFYLGKAYEMSGQNADAMEQHQAFLDHCADRDTDFPLISEVEASLTRMRNSP
jgi:tetratricopeptide (TPR) repeat protein